MVLVDQLERLKSKLIGNEIERDTGVPIHCCANIVEIMHSIKPDSVPADQREILAKHLTSG